MAYNKPTMKNRGNRPMRYPDFLKDGDTIAFCAPSFGCNTEPYRSRFDSALETFAQMGYGLLPGPNVYAGDGTGISTAPEKCGMEFTELYLSDASQALLSCGGGELMCEILRYVDFDAVRNAKPKWFQGYSDNTNLVFTLTTLCDTAAVYGPCAPAFGMRPWHPAIPPWRSGWTAVFFLDFEITPYHQGGEHNQADDCYAKINESFDIALNLVHSIYDISVFKCGHLFLK